MVYHKFILVRLSTLFLAVSCGKKDNSPSHGDAPHINDEAGNQPSHSQPSALPEESSSDSAETSHETPTETAQNSRDLCEKDMTMVWKDNQCQPIVRTSIPPSTGTPSPTDNRGAAPMTGALPVMAMVSQVRQLGPNQEAIALVKNEYLGCGVLENLLPSCLPANGQMINKNVVQYNLENANFLSVTYSQFVDQNEKYIYYAFSYFVGNDYNHYHNKNKFKSIIVYATQFRGSESYKFIQDSIWKIQNLNSTKFANPKIFFAELESTIGLFKVGDFDLLYRDDDGLVEKYLEQSDPISFLHWSQYTFEKEPYDKKITYHFNTNFERNLLIASDRYEDAYFELGLYLGKNKEFQDLMNEAFKSIWNNSKSLRRDKAALAVLTLTEIDETNSELFKNAKDFLKSESSQKISEYWLNRSLELYRRYGVKLGQSSDLARYVYHNSSHVKANIAKSLEKYNDFTTHKTLLLLSIDLNEEVRNSALKSLETRTIDGKDMNLQDLIKDATHYTSRVSLARALNKVTGKEADYALLTLVIDAFDEVRLAALKSLETRTIDGKDMNLQDLIKDATHYTSRVSLAQALRRTTGTNADFALLTLALDSYHEVGLEALKIIESRVIDGSQMDLVRLSSHVTNQQKINFAKALQYVSGDNATTLLEQMATEDQYDLKQAALNSLKFRRH